MVDSDAGDALSFQLALSLQLEDLEATQTRGKGKQRASDSDAALQIFYSLLREDLQVLEDQAIAQSFAEAVSSDAGAIYQALLEEEEARFDRQVAREQHEGAVDKGEPVTTALSRILPIEDDILQILSVDALDANSSTSRHAPGDSTSFMEQQAEAHKLFSSRKFECAVCFGVFWEHRTNMLSCGDRYCHGCLRSLFLRATTDDTLYPPRCCRQPIPFELVRPQLTAEEVAAFTRSVIEFTTPDRTYCSNAGCGQFIMPRDIEEGRAPCHYCSSETCATCKRAFHGNDDCPEDEALQEVVRLAADEGWQRCQNCRTMVELTFGCYHILCKCRAEFCYICGVPWKQCPCEQWQEDRLVRRAEQIVDREHDGPALPENARAQEVAVVRQQLIERHECDHPGWWTRQEGPNTCEFCNDIFRKFILVCPTCHIMACVDCRKNRT